MKVNELMIGNFVNFNGTHLIVNGFWSVESGMIAAGSKDKKIYSGVLNCNEFEPIKITEEWLLRFGFEKNIENNIVWWLGDVMIWKLPNGSFKLYYGDIRWNEIKYVHQLQNLFFALKGKELTLKND